jgi:tripartite-type tricarboxylate transporter receptor subunit TctC
VKREPGRHSFGHDGVGTASHLTIEVLKRRLELDMSGLPYRGGAPLTNDLLAGHVKIGITGLPTLQPHIVAGTLRAIAITTGERVPSVPGAATLREQGVDLVAPPWSGFFAPKGTPPAIVEKLAADIVAVMAEPGVRSSMEAIGNTLAPSGPAAFRSFVEAEIKSWAEAVRLSGASVE